jgi:hypothetical protein
MIHVIRSPLPHCGNCTPTRPRCQWPRIQVSELIFFLILFNVRLWLTDVRASRPSRAAAASRVAQKEESENDLDTYGEEDTKVG